LALLNVKGPRNKETPNVLGMFNYIKINNLEINVICGKAADRTDLLFIKHSSKASEVSCKDYLCIYIALGKTNQLKAMIRLPV
jgi:hypothetical protein